MKKGVNRKPRIPTDPRLVELASIEVSAWFYMHVLESLTCACNNEIPDPGCDLGHALYRITVAEVCGSPRISQGDL